MGDNSKLNVEQI